MTGVQTCALPICTFKKLASFIAYWVSIKVRAFALELAKVEVKT